MHVLHSVSAMHPSVSAQCLHAVIFRDRQAVRLMKLIGHCPAVFLLTQV